jgi:hypothetical protein
MTEPRRESPKITGDEELRGSIYRHFKKLSIGGIGQLDPCFYRVNPLAELQAGNPTGARPYPVRNQTPGEAARFDTH